MGYFIFVKYIIECLYPMIWSLFRFLGRNLSNFFVGFFGKFKTSKSHSETNWPLVQTWIMRLFSQNQKSHYERTQCVAKILRKFQSSFLQPASAQSQSQSPLVMICHGCSFFFILFSSKIGIFDRKPPLGGRSKTTWKK